MFFNKLYAIIPLEGMKIYCVITWRYTLNEIQFIDKKGIAHFARWSIHHDGNIKIVFLQSIGGYVQKIQKIIPDAKLGKGFAFYRRPREKRNNVLGGNAQRPVVLLQESIVFIDENCRVRSAILEKLEYGNVILSLRKETKEGSVEIQQCIIPVSRFGKMPVFYERTSKTGTDCV